VGTPANSAGHLAIESTKVSSPVDEDGRVHQKSAVVSSFIDEDGRAQMELDRLLTEEKLLRIQQQRTEILLSIAVSSKKALVKVLNDADQAAPSQLSQDEETVDFARRDGEEMDPTTRVADALIAWLGDKEPIEGSEEEKVQKYEEVMSHVHTLLVDKMAGKLDDHVGTSLKVRGKPAVGSMKTPNSFGIYYNP
jgi:hypothetical protein